MSLKHVPAYLAAIAMTLFAVPAWATGDIICEAVDDSGASISIAVGRLPILSVLNAVATDGVTTWSTDPGAGETEFVFGQGYMDDRGLRADFTDPNIERVVVSLQLVRGAGDKTFAEAGVLDFDGISVFPVSCIEG